jgi:7-carboxy-7-deazaguanine synthase
MYGQAEGEEVTPAEVEAWVRHTGLELVLLTGGEPLLQPELPALAARLAEHHTVLVETSGAHDISVLRRPVIRSVDVKCPGSGEAARNRWSNLAELRAGDAVKMVLTGEDDYAYAVDVIRRHGLGPPLNILLSCSYPHLKPETLARWMLRDRLRVVRLNLQLHRLGWPGLEPGTRGAK